MTATATDSRALAVEALVRIEAGGAYANLLVPSMLDEAADSLDERDRRFTTELVYGTVRMKRACDWLCDRFLTRDVEPRVRAALRLGAYQLAFLGTPPHAAVDATVAATPRRARGLVNAVLRRVAGARPDHDDDWPSPAVRLSYPDWIVERLVADLGEDPALGALAAMNEAGEVAVRDDGYVQDRASQWVVEHVEAGPGQRAADLCAAPGGKATGLARAGARVVALELRPARAGLVAANAARLGVPVATVVADARRPPLRLASFERVLLDAPCSGLGALRRRPDARWRITPDAVPRLAALQRDLADAAVELLAPGGRLVYSVCTLTAAESLAVADHVSAAHPHLDVAPAPGPPWSPYGAGARLLPQDEGTDGMCVFAWTAS